jgi:serine/threonine-protein kinase
MRGGTAMFEGDATYSSTAPAADEPETLPAGSRAGAYVIERAIGAGGGGVVYAAEHQLLHRPAAVKVLRRGLVSSPIMVARFLREATTVNLIRHPNIIDIYEFGQLEDGRPFYVMELLQGTDLGKLLKLHGRFSAAEALDLLEPVCEALEAAHKVGVVHRDLKASNVIVAEIAGRRVIKLVDFGIAKLMHSESGAAGLTDPGVLLGSVRAMSPEQVRCEPVDARSDIYSLGVLLYQLLTSAYPFSARPEQVAWMHLEAPAPRPSQSAPVSTALDAVVLRCLEKERRQRYQTVTALLDDLRRAVRGDEPSSDLEITGTAIGLYMEIRLDVRDEDLDDALLEDMTNVLDTGEAALRAAQFALAIHTSNALLGVKMCPEDPAAAVACCKYAQDVARALLTSFGQRDQADARVHVNVSLHADEATLRGSAEQEVTGGPLLDVDQWAAQKNADDAVESLEFRTFAGG